MDDIKKLESILKLMQEYKVSAVKVGEIEVAGMVMPIQEDDLKSDGNSNDDNDDLLFYSAGN